LFIAIICVACVPSGPKKIYVESVSITTRENPSSPDNQYEITLNTNSNEYVVTGSFDAQYYVVKDSSTVYSMNVSTNKGVVNFLVDEFRTESNQYTYSFGDVTISFDGTNYDVTNVTSEAGNVEQQLQYFYNYIHNASLNASVPTSSVD